MSHHFAQFWCFVGLIGTVVEPVASGVYWNAHGPVLAPEHVLTDLEIVLL